MNKLTMFFLNMFSFGEVPLPAQDVPVESGELTGKRERVKRLASQIADNLAEKGFHRDCGNYNRQVIENELETMEEIIELAAPQPAPLQPSPNWPIIPGRSVNASYRAGFSEAYRLCVKAYEESLAAAPPRGEGSTPAGYGLTEFVQSVQSAVPPRETEGQHKDETGWLLENGDKQPKYIGVIDGMLGWTDDHLKALRLSRRADADALAEIVEDCWQVVEHMWPAPVATKASEPAEGQPGKVDVRQTGTPEGEVYPDWGHPPAEGK